MIDVKSVVDGTFQPKNMAQCLEGYVALEQMQEDVDSGRGNMFGFLVIRARSLYGEWAEKAEGWNDSKITWYEFASQVFNQEAATQISAGEVQGFSKKQMSTFMQAIRVLKKTMALNGPLLERDDASGAFVLTSKASFEKWNKAEDERREAELQAASREAAAQQGITGVFDGGKEGEAETSTGLRAQLAPAVREALEEYEAVLVDEQKKLGEEAALNSVKLSIQHAKAFVNKRIEELLDAANADKTGTDA